MMKNMSYLMKYAMVNSKIVADFGDDDFHEQKKIIWIMFDVQVQQRPFPKYLTSNIYLGHKHKAPKECN